MTGLLVIVIALLVLVVAVLSVAAWRGRDRPPAPPPATTPARILFPFVAEGLAPRALDAALRLARAEQGTLVPVFLARVALHLPLETPLPRQSRAAIPLQEAIEQRAMAFGVPVESRIERGEPSATRCARRSSTSASTGSSSRPPAAAVQASTRTTSPGC